MKIKRRIIASAIVLVIAVLIGKGVVSAARSLSTPEAPIPTARVERGDVQIDVFTSGRAAGPAQHLSDRACRERHASDRLDGQHWSSG